MSYEVQYVKNDFGGQSNGRLLQDIEEISKSLYAHNNKAPTKALLSPSYHTIKPPGNNAHLSNPKPKFLVGLLRKWKPLKTLAHMRNRRFSCCFFVHIHAIEGLPMSFNNLNLCVNWIRKESVLKTRPAQVCCGTAEFRETLMHHCSVYGSRSGPHGCTKYKPKLFLLKASVPGSPGLDIGEHWIDLTRLLPLTLEELLAEGKRNSGKWSTCFKLSGKAEGALLNVSFCFSVFNSNSSEYLADNKVVEGVPKIPLDEKRFGDQGSAFDPSITFTFRKPIEGKQENLVDSTCKYTTKEHGDLTFTLSDLGIEVYNQNQVKSEQESIGSDNSLVETINVADIFQDYDTDELEEEEEEPTVEELESIDQCDYSSLGSLDDVTEAVANDFLNMLENKDGPKDSSADFDLMVVNQQVKKEKQRLTASIRDKRNLKMLENLETESLMSKWKLDERSFQLSPCSTSGGFGSPIYLPPEEQLELPSLGEGLGHTIRTKSEGFLRSMSPLLFKGVKNGARLIVQVSRGAVLPVVMGCTVMEILERWALEGLEKFSVQANTLMPLDDITGKTMEQIARESGCGPKTDERLNMPKEFQKCCEVDGLDYVSHEDLLPIALAKVEPLAIEGLRIQCNMSDAEPPSSIRLSPAHKENRCYSYDELVNLTLSLDEWVKLDADCFDDEYEISEKCSKISGINSSFGQNYGLLDRNFTLAMRVQLRDPSRNAEMVGAPMIALVQVERSFYPVDQNALALGSNARPFSRFKISTVHLSGTNVENMDMGICGTRRQRECGSRWLRGSGVSRTKRRPLLEMEGQNSHDDILWSISSQAHGGIGLASLNIHVRNPNILFPK
ncbi:unnamed protein product [Cuscuta campestris]|uniref:C2 NT-type domain-containing protein n=1 Tax=Cuscuta campestris TaxID=132261 RepID=A0A484K532_9ASTE|nr:unnamed protein product [Cuscuta campestris]